MNKTTEKEILLIESGYSLLFSDDNSKTRSYMKEMLKDSTHVIAFRGRLSNIV